MTARTAVTAGAGPPPGAGPRRSGRWAGRGDVPGRTPRRGQGSLWLVQALAPACHLCGLRLCRRPLEPAPGTSGVNPLLDP